MGLRYIVDTNIISELMRPAPHAGVTHKWRVHLNSIGLTSISWHELRTGVERLPAGRKKNAFSAFLNQLKRDLTILPYDQHAADWHAEERVRLMNKGLPPSYADSQIAAITATHNLILVTRNVVDFQNFEDITVENWFDDD